MLPLMKPATTDKEQEDGSSEQQQQATVAIDPMTGLQLSGAPVIFPGMPVGEGLQQQLPQQQQQQQQTTSLVAALTAADDSVAAGLHQLPPIMPLQQPLAISPLQAPAPASELDTAQESHVGAVWSAAALDNGQKRQRLEVCGP